MFHPRPCSFEHNRGQGNSSGYSSEPPRALVEAAIRFDEIGQAPIGKLYFSGIPQYPRPFASGFGVHNLGISGAENHHAEWLGLHLRCVVLQAKSRPSIFHGAVEALPSPDKPEYRLQINVHGIAAIGSLILLPRLSDLR
jgi:hypothetical protein